MELIQIDFDFEEELKKIEGSFEWDEIVDINFWKNIFLKNMQFCDLKRWKFYIWNNKISNN